MLFVFPLNCGLQCLSGFPIEVFHTILIVGQQNGAHVQSSGPIGCLDSLTNVYVSAADFILFCLPLEQALKGGFHWSQNEKKSANDFIQIRRQFLETYWGQ